MSLSRVLLVIPLALIFTGCSIAPMNFTGADISASSKPIDVNLQLVTVDYGAPEEGRDIDTADGTILPLWQKGILDATNRARIFDVTSSQAVEIYVSVVELDTPAMGLEMVTKTGAVYEVIDRKTRDVLFTTTIFSEGRVPVSYAFVGAERAIESINRSVKANISEFILQLQRSAN